MSVVINLEARRRPCCPRHALERVIERMVSELVDQGDALLIPRTVLETAIEDLRNTTDRITERPSRRDTR
jgi:hypothetical protein